VLFRSVYRAEEIVGKTQGIGWGFTYALSQTYSDFYADYSGEMDEEDEL